MIEEEEYFENLLTVPVIYRVKISPDGKKVAFSWKNVHSNIDVFYISLSGNSEPIALTETPEATMNVNFYPKSNAVLVGEDKSRNERVRLFRVNLDEPKKMIGLTEDDPSFFIRGGTIHPNEKWLIYGANFDPKENKEIEPTWIYRHELENGETVVLAKPIKPAWLSPSLCKSGDYILYNRKELHPKGEQIWLVDIDGRDDREILNFGDKARVYAHWLPDSQRIVFLTDTKNGQLQKHYSLGSYNIQTEEINWLIDDPKRNIEKIDVPINGEHIVIIEYEKAKPKASIINLQGMDEIILPRLKGNLIPIAPILDKEWLGKYYSSTQPDELVKFNLEDDTTEKFVYLTNVWKRTKLRREDLTQAEEFNWKAKDALAIHGWFYQPKNPNGKTIIYIHGGPTAHSEDEINAQIQYYLHRGFAVLDPNYRGSTGYGVEFEELIKVNGWGSDEQEDIWAGVQTLIEKGFATKGKVGITGTSYWRIQ